MKKSLRTLAALLLCIAVAGCGHHTHGEGESHHGTEEHEGHHHDEGEHHHDEDGHHHEDGEEHHVGEIVFSEEKQASFGVETAEVTLQPFSSVIRTSGSILPAKGEEVTVAATTSGVFHFRGNAISEGSYISKGSAFATINTQSIDGGDPVSNAKAAYEAAEKEYLRDTELLKDNIISTSHYDQSKLEYERTKAAYEALTRSGYSNGGLNVTAPLGGYVQSLYVSEGQYVSTGEPLAVISQNRRLQLRAELPEKYYPRLHEIESATFVTSDGSVHSLKDLGGRLLSYSRSAVDHFLPVTFEFNAARDIAPGSYVDIYLITREKTDAIIVPVGAITESQGIYSVYVQIEPDAFIRRDVTVGESDGQNVRIISGLEPGETVVVRGAMQIRLASVAAVPSGHNHQH